MILLDIFVFPLLYLLGLYIVGIQYQRGGPWGILKPVALFATVVDVVLNYTTVSILFWEWPEAGEYTITKRLQRLINGAGWRTDIALPLAKLLNFFAPNGDHVKLKKE